MADYVINAPGTVVNPYTPAGSIVFGNGLASNATGIRGHNSTNATSFAHNVQYGNVITTTMTFVQINPGGDDAFIGGVIRTGVNAGSMSGLYIQSGDCILASWAFNSGTGAFTKTNIGSSATTIVTAPGDVFALTMTNSGSLFTFSNFTQNGSAIALIGPTTSATFASETSMSAGGWLDCGNTNNTFFSQFTGTGVASGGIPTTSARRIYILP